MIKHPQPRQRASGNELLLLEIHGVRGVAEVAGGARFDLDEDELVGRFVAADDVDFAAPTCAEVAVENAMALFAQMLRGKELATAPKRVRKVFRRRRRRPAEPGENCGDESGKAHGGEGARGATR